MKIKIGGVNMSKREVVEFLKVKKAEQGKAVVMTEKERKITATNKAVSKTPRDNRIRVM